MNYIILDLEWNQSPDGKEYSYKDIPFEIIQIGAVKLDEKFRIVSEFDRFVKPQLYMKMHKIVEELLCISMDELNQKGEIFEIVIKDFLEWCGEDYIFCTWGSTDLIELQRNIYHYNIDYKPPKPFLFYDLQKLYSINFSDGDTRITLQRAIDEQCINSEEEYHMAINDARYTAKIMQTLDFAKVKKFYSVDTYRIPVNKKDEIYLNFGDYGKYISRGFKTRENAASDREVRSCKCFICGSVMKKCIKWFATGTKIYHGLFQCEEHGYMRGRLRIKSTDDGRYYAVRTFKFTDENGIKEVQEKKDKEKQHRREVRLRAK